MDKRIYLATYTVSFASPKIARSLDPEQFALQLFSFINSGHLLLIEDEEDTFGVDEGDLSVTAVRDLAPNLREYDVRHRLSLESRPDEDPDERVANFLAETLGIPQQEGPWWIKELALHFEGSSPAVLVLEPSEEEADLGYLAD